MIAALLGGSFDPVHSGHVAMARHVLEHALAGHVFVVPNARSPWRDEPAAPAADRLAMCRLAFAGMPEVTVDGREAAQSSPVRSVDTLEALAAARPGTAWRLVVGADHLATFTRWHRWERILELAELLVVARDGAGCGAADVARAGLPADRVVTAPPFCSPVSASEVRAILSAGGDASRLVPAPVAQYIAAHALYRGA